MADQNNSKKGMSPFFAAVIGSIVGASAVFLSRKENREKIGQKYGEAKSKGMEIKDKVQEKGEEAQEKMRGKARDMSEQAEEEIKRRNAEMQM